MNKYLALSNRTNFSHTEVHTKLRRKDTYRIRKDPLLEIRTPLIVKAQKNPLGKKITVVMFCICSSKPFFYFFS